MRLLDCLRWTRFAIAVLVIGCPALLWVTFGQAEGFAQRAQTEFPSAMEALAPEMAGRDQLADALADRSVARKHAVGFLNQTRWRAFGFIDDDRIASGSSGYLFYKQQFTEWSCEAREQNAVALDRLLLMTELAHAADTDFAVLIAPNKATVMREEVRGRAAALPDCYDETQARVRRLAQLAPPGTVVDHGYALLNWSDRRESFFRTDTHWNTRGGIFALQHFFEETGDRFGPGIEITGQEPQQVETDLAGVMLQMGLTEPDMAVSVEAASPATGASRNVAVLHDSFYARVRPALQAGLWPHALHYVNRDDEAILRQALQRADAVALQRVERRLLDEMFGGFSLGPQGALSEWIMTRNRQAAETCVFDAPAPFDSVSALRVEGADFARLSAQGRDPILIVPLPDYARSEPFCLRLVVRKEGGFRSQIFFPGSQFARLYGLYSAGRVIAFESVDELEVLMVAPAAPDGQIRLDPVNAQGAFQIEGLAFGRLPD